VREVIYKDDNDCYLFKMSSHEPIAIDDGSIIHIKGITLELENDLLYEVRGDEYDIFGNIKWERTGKVMTPQELNKI
jgi:hypothetical protein